MNRTHTAPTAADVGRRWLIRTLLISTPMMLSTWGHVLNAEEVKKLFVAGEHYDGEVRWRVLYDAVPHDAVIAEPEEDAELWVNRYSVISDEFSDDDPPVILPHVERVTR